MSDILVDNVDQEIWVDPVEEDVMVVAPQEEDPYRHFSLFVALSLGYLSARFSATFKAVICLSSLYCLEGFISILFSLILKANHCHGPCNEVANFFFGASFSTFICYLLFVK